MTISGRSISDRTLEHWRRLYTPFRMLIFRDYGCGNVCNEEPMCRKRMYFFTAANRGSPGDVVTVIGASYQNYLTGLSARPVKRANETKAKDIPHGTARRDRILSTKAPIPKAPKPLGSMHQVGPPGYSTPTMSQWLVLASSRRNTGPRW